jgi:hypothetical protein
MDRNRQKSLDKFADEQRPSVKSLNVKDLIYQRAQETSGFQFYMWV